MRTTTALLSLLVGYSLAAAQEPIPPQPPLPPPIVAPPPPQYYDPPPAYLQPGPPPPERYQLRPSYALIFSGVGVVGFGYILDISGTLLTSHQPAWESAIPVVGPYLQVGDTFSRDWSDLAKGFYVFDGLVQTTGLVLTILGASLWHRAPVRTAHNGLVVTF